MIILFKSKKVTEMLGGRGGRGGGGGWVNFVSSRSLREAKMPGLEVHFRLNVLPLLTEFMNSCAFP